MRSVFIMVLSGVALCGCATDPSVHRQASLNCQAVGIGEQDPQFATCAQAYTRQHLDGQLSEGYQSVLRSLPFDAERRIIHQDGY